MVQVNHKDEENTQQIRKALYKYPEYESPEYVMELEDLTEDDLILACKSDPANQEFKIFIWKGSNVVLDEDVFRFKLGI